VIEHFRSWQVGDLPHLVRCYITDRRTLPPGRNLLDSIARNLHDGADWIQIREKDLSARALYELVQTAMALHNPRGIAILVNTRVDVALAAGASGVHLPSRSPSPRCWRGMVPTGFLIGVSCHTADEVRSAGEEGADYVVFGPVFTPLSKGSDLPPRGLDGLAHAVAAASIPVLALGGITEENIALCEGAGAAGIAGISLFQT
jgi:thiamine-phosphate pyrophosphorylase